MRRDFGCEISESSVGRIMKKLHLPRSISASVKKKSRKFNKYAEKFKFKKYAEMEIGENVQIDHMMVCKNGMRLKHFTAWERFSKYVYANVYSNAKSSTAAQFLREPVAPYKIKTIQVDGCSEFMKDFENECKELGFPLVVLPPARPKYNGGVERSNRICREEFYETLHEDSLQGVRLALQNFIKKYDILVLQFKCH